MPLDKVKALEAFYNADLIKFILVGVSSSLSYLIVLSILSIFYDWESTPSIIMAYLVGTLVSYLGTVLFAFRKEMSRNNLIKFLVIVGISFVINVLISEVLSPLGFHTVLIGMINITVVGLFNYLSHKFWTFK